MEGWVLGSISIATIIYVLGFIMILTYKRDKVKEMDEKLNALNNILDSCDKMIDELNNLSDYIITNIEDKSSKLVDLSEQADKKIKEFHFHVKSAINIKPTINSTEDKSINDSVEVQKKSIKKTKTEIDTDTIKVEPSIVEPYLDIKPKKIKVPKEAIEKSIPEKVSPQPKSSVINAYENNIKLAKSFENANDINKRSTIETIEISDHTELLDKSRRLSLMLNAKTKEVLELSKQGMDTTEIAKKLGIGKGEIELILSMKK